MKLLRMALVTLSTMGLTSAMASGEGTYKAVCAACHSTAFPKSPQLGDKAKWTPLIKEGQVTLTSHAYAGVRGMPAKGGRPDLSLQDFSEAVNYMVNQSGGQWTTADAKTLKAMQAEVAVRQKKAKPAS